MKFVVVLAGNSLEAAAHARRHRLPRGRWRYAVRASSIRRLRAAEIHILPGFKRRLDRHSILAELRYVKGERIRFYEPRGYLGLEDSIEPAYREHEERLNAGRLSYDEALEQAYITQPVQFVPAPVKRKSKAPEPKPEELFF